MVGGIAAEKARQGTSGPDDIGKLRGVLRRQVGGKGDMGEVSRLVKQSLGWDRAAAKDRQSPKARAPTRHAVRADLPRERGR